MEKYRKANELGKTLRVEEKLAKIPLRELVERQLCKQKNLNGVGGNCPVQREYVFEKLKTQRILRVECNFELKILN
ncbi:hypothetical protein [Emticicia sp. W12TSBA100-4]|uniref:hypothetical protein n=1 Tax=Emticicia sp. W12TSBA100-4 TaxID=3160965 RepID=UPI0033056505